VADYDQNRAVAFSLQLAQAHQQLRQQFHQLKSGLGRQRVAKDSLIAHCLAFCAALTSHHEGEDSGIFAELLRERPDLAGTVSKLVEDHHLIAWILSRVTELADRAAGADTAPGASAPGASAPGASAPGASAPRAGTAPRASNAPGADTAALEAINRELDGLAAIMESHFSYEERAIGRALKEGLSTR
jgi:Hemerythrin HHE cation binding domain